MAFVVAAFDGRLLDGAIHPLDVAVGLWMVWLGEPMLNVVGLANHVEAHLARERCVAATRLISKLDAIIRQDRVDAIGNRFSRCSRNSQAVRRSALSTS